MSDMLEIRKITVLDSDLSARCPVPPCRRNLDISTSLGLTLLHKLMWIPCRQRQLRSRHSPATVKPSQTAIFMPAAAMSSQISFTLLHTLWICASHCSSGSTLLSKRMVWSTCTACAGRHTHE